MRRNVTKKHNTRAERVFAEIIKSLRLPFQAKVVIGGREVDFIVKNYAVDIDCHDQDSDKNSMLYAMGFIPLHYSNRDILQGKKQIIKWLEQIFSLPTEQ